MRVVVTGGAGFIGSHCVDLLLERGHDVVVVDDFSTGHRENLKTAQEISQRAGRSLEILEASILDPTLWESRLAPANAIFHLASQSSVVRSVEAMDEDYTLNVEPIRPILAWIQRSETPCHMVFGSTAGAVYGDAEIIPTDERQPLRPVSPYGATKAFFELYLSAFSASRKSAGTWSSYPQSREFFTWASLRISNVYGPRQRTKLIPTLIEQIARGEVPTVYGGDSATRDYIHVSDVAQAFLATLERMVVTNIDECFNISTSTEASALAIFDQVLDAMIERAEKAGGQMGPLAAVYKVKDPGEGPLRPGEARRTQFTNFKAQSYLNWRPVRKFDEALRETVLTYPL